MNDLAKKIEEIIKIVKICPEKFQEKCFEVLLSHYLNRLSTKREEGQRIDKPGGEGEELKQGDIKQIDIHLKVHKFLKKYGLSLGDLNELFYKEGDEFKTLYEELKTTSMKEGQIRIALLQSLKNAMKTGDFIFHVEQVRAECDERKCYHKANFTAHFNLAADLFDKFTKYNKNQPEIKLSEEGRKALAEVIKELSQ